MGKKKSLWDQFIEGNFSQGHNNGARPSTREKHEDANRGTGSGKPNSKSGVKYRHWKNKRK